MKILNNVVVVLALIYPTSFGLAANEGRDNLFPLGTFDTFAGNLPTGWTEEIWNQRMMRVKFHPLSPGRDGTGSCLEIEPGNAMSLTTLKSPASPVSPDQPYLFKGYYASTCRLLATTKKWLNAEGVEVKGTWLDAEEKPVGDFTIVLPDTQDRWIEFYKELRSPKTAQQLQIAIIRRWVGGRLRFDDFSIRKGDIMDYEQEFSLPPKPDEQIFPIFGWVTPFRTILSDGNPGRHREIKDTTENQLLAEFALCNFTIGSGEFGQKVSGSMPEDDEEFRAVGQDPNVFWFFGDDEPLHDKFGRLAKVRERVERLAPEKPLFVNLLPTYGFGTLEEYDNYVKSFIENVKPAKMFTYDHYCLVGRDPKTHAESRHSPHREGDYFPNLEIVRHRAQEADLEFGVILSVGIFGGVRGASDAELRWQAFTTLAYGSRYLGWFCYLTEIDYGNWNNWSDMVINRDGTRTRHYAMLKYLNGEVLAWGPTLLKLKSTGVYHTEPLPLRTRPVKKSKLVESVSGGMALVGEFESTDGQTCLMVVNRDFIEPASFHVVLRKPAAGVSMLSRQDGQWQTVEDYDPETGALTLPLSAGNAELLRLE